MTHCYFCNKTMLSKLSKPLLIFSCCSIGTLTLANTPFIKPSLIAYCHNRKLNDGRTNGIAYISDNCNNKTKMDRYFDKLIYYENNKQFCIIPHNSPTMDNNKLFTTCVRSTNFDIMHNFKRFMDAKKVKLSDVKVTFDNIKLMIIWNKMWITEKINFIHENGLTIDYKDAHTIFIQRIMHDEVGEEHLRFFLVNEPDFVEEVIRNGHRCIIDIKYVTLLKEFGLLQHIVYFDSGRFANIINGRQDLPMETLLELFSALSDQQKFDCVKGIFNAIDRNAYEPTNKNLTILFNKIKRIDGKCVNENGENLAFIFEKFKHYEIIPNSYELTFPYPIGKNKFDRTPLEQVEHEKQQTSSDWYHSYEDSFGGGCYSCSSSSPSTCFLI